MAKLIDFLAAGIIDKSGNPLDSGKVFVYEVGTTTPIDVFADAALTQLLTNPFILSSTGVSKAFVNKDCRVLIEDMNGVVIEDIDALGTTTEFAGSLTLGNTPADIVTFNASIVGDLIPFIDNTYIVGSGVKRWKEGHFVNLFADGDITVLGNFTQPAIFLQSVVIDTTLNVVGNANVTGLFTAGSTDSVTANNFWETVTRPIGINVGKRGIAISNESAGVSETTTTPQDIGVSSTLSATGRPVMVFLTCDASLGFIRVQQAANSNSPQAIIRLKRDAALIHSAFIQSGDAFAGGGADSVMSIPPGSIMACDQLPGPGTYVYTCTIETLNNGTGTTIHVDKIRIVAYEL